jgi:large subunit ribosomal protein L6
MSRIGKLPISIPAGVTIAQDKDGIVNVKGPKGELSQKVDPSIKVKIEDGQVTFEIDENSAVNIKQKQAFHGLYRALVNNMVVGVSEGYTKTLEINGVGYRAQKSGKVLTLLLGYSHPIEMEDPEGIETSVDGNKILVKGINKEAVGQHAADIRSKRGPEPYKGKGIKYDYETIRRKVGKTGKK